MSLKSQLKGIHGGTVDDMVKIIRDNGGTLKRQVFISLLPRFGVKVETTRGASGTLVLTNEENKLTTRIDAHTSDELSSVYMARVLNSLRRGS